MKTFMLQAHSAKQKKIILYLKNLRDRIIDHFEIFEHQHLFHKKPWNHLGGGGGEIGLLRGDVFEKAAVNWSGVYGDDLPFKTQSIDKEPFFATGISIITHMVNPFMPTVHMNIRYIETARSFWFGEGYDLTPMGFDNKKDTDHFHNQAKKELGTTLYEQFSQQATNYYYIKHWKKERGAGGIFFDHYNTGDFETDFSTWKKVGTSFLPAILPIYHRNIDHPYTTEDKAKQNACRAHYVEFNLLYDKGTKFGFLSGGNPEAILCSMPPSATW